ncbi:MAG: hemerythrin domain-containing protein [Acidimicrobiales bacterium]|jgi:hemerythrin-like domain-containing protein
MPIDGPVLTDTRDMIALHDAFKRALRDAPSQIASVVDGDTLRARRFGDYLGEVLWLLHAHHEAEDELLYPLLSERAPEDRGLFSRMEGQHAALTSSTQAVEGATGRFGTSGSAVDGRALAKASESLRDTLTEHLDEEEEAVLPIAARCVSPPEWGRCRRTRFRTTPARGCGCPSDLCWRRCRTTYARTCWRTFPRRCRTCGSAAFASEMALVRQGAA